MDPAPPRRGAPGTGRGDDAAQRSVVDAPPGLWAALVLLATEWLRVRDRHLRNSTFWAEWLNVSLALAVISLIYSFTLTLMFDIADAYFLSVMQFSLTVILYPLVVLVSRLLFGVRRTAPRDNLNQGGPT